MSIFIFKKIGGGNSLKSLLLALLLSVAGLLNAQQFTVGNLNYSVNSDGVSVCVEGHVDGTSATGALNIPGTVTYNGNDYTVTEIGDQAFKCSGLTSLTLPNSLKFIGSNAFWSCTSITSFTIPNSVTSIGADAFLETGWWNNQPNGVVYKDNCCLGYKGNKPIGTLEIAEGTRLIQGQAFSTCHDLTSLTLPNSLKAIGGYAFNGCTGITTINIPNSVTLIGIYAFYNTGWWNSQPNGIVYKDNCCLGYKGNKPTGALQIADGTRLIVTSAFNNCNDLTSVSFPNSLDVICNYAFYGCSGLTSIESLASTPPILYEYSFGDVNHSIPVTVPHGTLAAYQSAPYWSEFTNFVEAGGSVTTIDAIHVNGFTVPAWGAHPDFELELPSDAHCTVSYVSWYQEGAGGSSFSSMASGDVFDCENCDYYMEVVLEPESGYEFAEHPDVYFNGDASVYDAGSSHLLTDGSYKAFTVNYQVTQPSVNIITEIRVEGFTAPEWGTHPDFSLTVPGDPHYAVDDVAWIYDGYEMEAGDVFDDESGTYYMLVYFVPESGYAFDPNATVLFNGDASVNDADYNAILSDGTFAAYTVDYQVTSPTPSTHTITATANPAAGGTVSGGGTFNSGETCTLTAMANSGYQFLNWTKNGAEVSANATYTFTVSESAQYVANFIQSQTLTYTLTVSCDPSMGAVTGNGTYAAGTVVTVEAIAYKGYVFERWNDGITANPRTVTLNGNMTLVAFFNGTGVDENGEALLNVYPNPAKESLRIEGIEANATVEIYNSLGMMVKTASASADEEINVSDLPQGIYMLRCGKQTVRFVKTM